MHGSSNPSRARRKKVYILIAATLLTLQVTAADENNSTISTPSISSDQPGQRGGLARGDASEKQEETMEEITITGQKQIFSLRKQIILAEDRAFKLYNELNDDDTYDIHCTMEAPIGSNLKRRICVPNFYWRATADNASEFLGLIGGYSNYSAPSPSAKSVFAYQYPILKDKVRELAKKSPELLDALRKNFELNEELKKTRNEYHGFDDE